MSFCPCRSCGIGAAVAEGAVGVEESRLAGRDNIRMGIRSFWWQKNKAPTYSMAFFPLWFIFSNACCCKDSMKNGLVIAV